MNPLPDALARLSANGAINFESLWRENYYLESNAYAAQDAGIQLPIIRTYQQGDQSPVGWTAVTREVLTFPRTVQCYPCVKTKSPGRKPWDPPDCKALARLQGLSCLDVDLDYSWDADCSANAAIDCWLLKNETGTQNEILAEVMVWFDMVGDIHPAGQLVEPQVPYVTVGPYSLELWQRADGSWPIFTFRLAPGSWPMGTVDLLPLIQHLITRGRIARDAECWVGDVEFGNELVEGELWCQLNTFAVTVG